jgi:hypothetical protein
MAALQGVAASSAVTSAACNYQQILQQCPAVLSQSKKLPPVVHSVQHHIETEGRPAASKYWRLDPGKLTAATQEFAKLEQQGIIYRSSSQWASPLHMVHKPDGSWQQGRDFWQLNLQTKPEWYSWPNIGDLTARLSSSTVFKLDIRKEYHQVPVKEDICKTVIVTLFGTFEFLRMPFGLRNGQWQLWSQDVGEWLSTLQSPFSTSGLPAALGGGRVWRINRGVQHAITIINSWFIDT